MTIEAVIFDLYGTLVDIWTDESDFGVYQTLCHFLRFYDINFAPEDLASRYREFAAAQILEHPGPFTEIDVFLVFEEILSEGLRGKSPERALVIWLARLFRSLSTRRLGLFPDSQEALDELGPPKASAWSVTRSGFSAYRKFASWGWKGFLTQWSCHPATMSVSRRRKFTATRSRP